MQAVAPEIVNAVGSAAKATFAVAADRLEQNFHGKPHHDSSEAAPLLRRDDSSNASSNASQDALSELTTTGNFGASGRVTLIAESVPIVGQLVAGTHLLAGNVREAKRAFAKSTKSTVMGSIAASAAVTGGALLGTYGAAVGLSGAALGALGWMGGAAAGSAAGEVAGGASQALIEATVYDEADRRRLGTCYLQRTPAQWGAGVAAASTAGVVGAGVGLHVDSTMLVGRIEQKVAGELAETVTERATLAMAPGLRRQASKRRRERLARLTEEETELYYDSSCEPPRPRRTRSHGYGAVPVVEPRAAEAPRGEAGGNAGGGV